MAASYRAPKYTIPNSYTSEDDVEQLELEWQDLCNEIEEEMKRESSEHGLGPSTEPTLDEDGIKDVLARFEKAFSLVFYDR